MVFVSELLFDRIFCVVELYFVFRHFVITCIPDQVLVSSLLQWLIHYMSGKLTLFIVADMLQICRRCSLKLDAH